jgi:hypothetical protein
VEPRGVTITDESPQDEIPNPSQVIGPYFEALLDGRTPKPLHLTIRDLQVRRSRKGVSVFVTFRNGPPKEIRMSKAWATVLSQRLNRVLG